jgi:hypothetical protein
MASPSIRRPHAVRVVASAGAVCGILDGLSAIGVLGFFGASPAQVFQGIAGGLLGRAAFTLGNFAVVVGIVAHFSVAFTAAAAYYLFSRVVPAVNAHAIAAAVLFGTAVHFFMNFVIIPLSAIGPRPIPWPVFLSIWAVHLVVVGPSISLTVRWFAEREQVQTTGPTVGVAETEVFGGDRRRSG